MRRELRRYSSIGNRDGFLLFCSKIFTGEWENLSSIKTSCSFIIGINLNFNCAEMLFEDLGLIEVREGECKSTELIFTAVQENDFIIKLCNVCLKYIINENLIDKELLKYDEGLNRFYIPTSSFRLDSAILRNLLKELSALELSGTRFYIGQCYEYLFIEFIRKKKTLSQADLMKKIEEEQRIGEEGELFVLDFEKRRLNANNEQEKMIKQISLIDVAAGYDIISYHDESFKDRRYIEVKTYLGKEHFYWSSNEIQSAKLRGKNYYLYLVEHSEIKNKDYSPLMIADPVVELQKDNTWNAVPNSFYVERVAGKIPETSFITESTLLNEIDNKVQEDISSADDTIDVSIFPDYHPNCIPLFSLRAACGGFIDGEMPEEEGWVDASGHGFTPNRDRHFVVHAQGNSMSSKIKDGDLCVFEWYNKVGGTREGDIVLIYAEDKLSDGSTYTIKKYHSEKRNVDDTWSHEKIILYPLNSDYDPIELEEGQKVYTVGVFKCVL